MENGGFDETELKILSELSGGGVRKTETPPERASFLQPQEASQETTPTPAIQSAQPVQQTQDTCVPYDAGIPQVMTMSRARSGGAYGESQARPQGHSEYSERQSRPQGHSEYSENQARPQGNSEYSENQARPQGPSAYSESPTEPGPQSHSEHNESPVRPQSPSGSGEIPNTPPRTSGNGGGRVPPRKPGKKKSGSFFSGRRRSIILMILVFAGALSIAIAILAYKYAPTNEHMDLSKFFVTRAPLDASVIVNGEFDEANAGASVDGAFDAAGNPYIELEFLKNTLDKGYTYDDIEGILRYATDSEVVTAGEGDQKYSVGRNSNDLGKPVVMRDGENTFVALDFVKLYTDIEYKKYNSPNRITIETAGTVRNTATITRDTAVRRNGGPKSLILEDAQKGEGVTVLENYGKWSKVLTEEGVLGYVENKRLSELQEETVAKRLPERVYNHIRSDKKICLLWHQTNTQVQNNDISIILERAKGINVIAPTWFVVAENNGSLESYASTAYVKAAHNAGVEVWATVNNIDIKTDGAQLLNRVSYRDALVNNIIAVAISNDLDGINIDFEALPPAAADGYRQFIRELSIKCEANDLVLSVDNYVPSPSSMFYDRENQADYADYVIIMGYDEHWGGSDTPGSTASLPFVKKGIENTLKEVPADQVILGMPFYTRVWEIRSNSVSSTVLSMGKSESWVKDNDVAPIWNEDIGQNVGEYEKDKVIYKVWLEDEQSLILKLQAMKDNKLAGGAFWKSGQEKASIWDIIVTYMR